MGGLEAPHSPAAAILLYFRLIARFEATNHLHAVFLIPITATLLGALVQGVGFASAQWVGMSLIGAGLLAPGERVLALRVAVR